MKCLLFETVLLGLSVLVSADRFRRGTISWRYTGWKLIFKVAQDQSISPASSMYDLWTGTYSMNEGDASAISLNTGTKTLKSSIIDNWGDYKISAVRVSMFKGGLEKAYVVFDANGADKNNWFDQKRIIYTSWNDLTTSSTSNYFSIVGHDLPQRRFFMQKSYGGCSADNGWFVAVEHTGRGCSWETQSSSRPFFLYSDASGSEREDNMAFAEVFAISVDINKCASSPCQHGGSCQHLINAYKCYCVAGYTGFNCQTNINECATSPCQHGGSCLDLINAYKCHCLDGYTGDSCQTSDCLLSSAYCLLPTTYCLLPTANSGTMNSACSSRYNTAMITACNSGNSRLVKWLCEKFDNNSFDMKTAMNTACSSDVNECQSNPCQHGGTCTDLVNGYICHCVNGYNGTHCQIDVNECESSPCINNATCIDGIASWSCACMAGFTGVFCQIDMDECNSYPCFHNGTCVDLINDYSCICANDSKGRNCEIWLDHCASMPCLHGGFCKNKLGGYTCDCQHPWYGDICEYKEINRTEVCTDLEYTECSCHINKLRQPVTKSYKVWSGLVGAVTGLVTTILFYIAWAHQGYAGSTNNIVKPNEVKNDDVSVSDIDAESNYTDSKEDEIIVSACPIHCTCFVDHTGYDHFQRYDPKNNRFRFHNCRHKKTITKLTSIASSKSSC